MSNAAESIQDNFTDEEAAAAIEPIAPLDAGHVGQRVIDALTNAPPDVGTRLMSAFTQWSALKDYKTKEGKRLNELLGGRIAQFKEAMEVGHSNSSDQILKLGVIETRWQDLEDAREGRKQVMKGLSEQVKASEQKIKDLISEAKTGQMGLFEDAPTVDAEPS